MNQEVGVQASLGLIDSLQRERI